MKKKVSVLLFLVLVLILCACEKTDKLQKAYDELQSKYAALEAEYNTLKSETSDWVKLTENEKAARASQAEAERIAAELAVEKAKEEQAAAERAAAEEAERKAQEEAAERERKETQGYESGITYDDLARNPDKYKDEKVKFTGKVLQVSELDTEIQIRLGTSGYGYYDNVIYIYFDRSLISARILEDDMITVYETAKGLHTYETVMRASVTLPLVKVDKIDT
ncbi:MAG: toxin regulator [Oscillospiraceae bacterium]|nr:toxin regulator [Oscillospiraceae bacterium]